MSEAKSPPRSAPDPLIAALARYIEALDRRYPRGPEQMRLATRAHMVNMRTVPDPERPPAA